LNSLHQVIPVQSTVTITTTNEAILHVQLDSIRRGGGCNTSEQREATSRIKPHHNGEVSNKKSGHHPLVYRYDGSLPTYCIIKGKGQNAQTKIETQTGRYIRRQHPSNHGNITMVERAPTLIPSRQTVVCQSYIQYGQPLQ